MQERKAIGIDPDARGFVCAYVKRSEVKVGTRGYMATDSDLKSFLKWAQGEGDVIIAIEGSNGWSRPIEKVLREARVVFYSFKPSDTDKFRKAVLGQNKTNKKDAESVAPATRWPLRRRGNWISTDGYGSPTWTCSYSRAATGA